MSIFFSGVPVPILASRVHADRDARVMLTLALAHRKKKSTLLLHQTSNLSVVLDGAQISKGIVMFRAGELELWVFM